MSGSQGKGGGGISFPVPKAGEVAHFILDVPLVSRVDKQNQTKALGFRCPTAAGDSVSDGARGAALALDCAFPLRIYLLLVL